MGNVAKHEVSDKEAVEANAGDEEAGEEATGDAKLAMKKVPRVRNDRKAEELARNYPSKAP